MAGRTDRLLPLKPLSSRFIERGGSWTKRRCPEGRGSNPLFEPWFIGSWCHNRSVLILRVGRTGFRRLPRVGRLRHKSQGTTRSSSLRRLMSERPLYRDRRPKGAIPLSTQKLSDDRHLYASRIVAEQARPASLQRATYSPRSNSAWDGSNGGSRYRTRDSCERGRVCSAIHVGKALVRLSMPRSASAPPRHKMSSAGC